MERTVFDYIMITAWSGHWDTPKAKSTLFRHRYISKDQLKYGPWPDEANTLFIKCNFETKTFEKSWRGKASNFRAATYEDEPAVRFDVSALQTFPCPEEFKKLSIGWHAAPLVGKTDSSLNRHKLNDVQKYKVANQASEIDSPNLFPQFFKEMETCDWASFENYTFILLRLIGIHDIHKVPQIDNRGKADGFFKLGSLAVLYDATLDSKFDQSKKVQVDNYVNQIKEDKITIQHHTFTIRDLSKQIWIITRGDTARLLKNEDSIKVKEIPIKVLIAFYRKRLSDEINLEMTCELLKQL